jgi:hypothetical protein
VERESRGAWAAIQAHKSLHIVELAHFDETRVPQISWTGCVLERRAQFTHGPVRSVKHTPRLWWGGEGREGGRMYTCDGNRPTPRNIFFRLSMLCCLLSCQQTRALVKCCTRQAAAVFLHVPPSSTRTRSSLLVSLCASLVSCSLPRPWGCPATTGQVRQSPFFFFFFFFFTGCWMTSWADDEALLPLNLKL